MDGVRDFERNGEILLRYAQDAVIGRDMFIIFLSRKL